MSKFFNMFRRNRKDKILPMAIHQGQWHPLFYKAVKVHIIETSSLNRHFH